MWYTSIKITHVHYRVSRGALVVSYSCSLTRIKMITSMHCVVHFMTCTEDVIYDTMHAWVFTLQSLNCCWSWWAAGQTSPVTVSALTSVIFLGSFSNIVKTFIALRSHGGSTSLNMHTMDHLISWSIWSLLGSFLTLGLFGQRVVVVTCLSLCLPICLSLPIIFVNIMIQSVYPINPPNLQGGMALSQMVLHMGHTGQNFHAH